MKNNEYLQKYGERALQLYRKSKRQSQQHNEAPIHLVPKNNASKHKSKSKSQKSLKHNKSKQKIHGSIQQPVFTFQKISHNKNKSKLLISGMSTPKNKISKSKLAHEERKRSSSTKKKRNHDTITGKLQEIVTYHKKQTKKMVLGAIQCIEMICHQQQKLNQWLNYIKDIMSSLAQQVSKYKTKWRSQKAKNNRLQKDIQNLQMNLQSTNIKKAYHQNQSALLNQNQKLKEKILKMQSKIKDFERKQMVLISTLEHYNIKRHEKTQTFPQIAHQNYHSSQEQQQQINSSDEQQSVKIG